MYYYHYLGQSTHELAVELVFYIRRFFYDMTIYGISHLWENYYHTL